MERLAEILEKASVEETTLLDNWDSLAVVSALVAIDEVTGVFVDTEELRNCASVRDVLILAGEA